MPNAELTPNVVVQHPLVRRSAQWVIGVAAIVLPAAAILDANAPTIDFSDWLVPATAVTSFLAGVFGIAVVVPNIPSEKRDAKELSAGLYVVDEGSETVEIEDLDGTPADDISEGGEADAPGKYGE